MSLSKKQALRGARYLFAELLIVFVGVYLAFQLNEYSSGREANQRREQLQQALAQEIDIFLLGADRFLPHLDTLYSDWRRRYDAGEKPVPLHFELGGADLPPRGMWQAVLASDGLATLPVEPMQIVSAYYNALDILLSKYGKSIEFWEQEIVPFEDLDTFYQADSSILRRKYAVHMQRMQEMLRLFREVQDMAKRSRASLDQGQGSSLNLEEDT
jgi:hypothetical protein